MAVQDRPPAGGPVWPSPPEKARVRYLFSISTPEDIGTGPSLAEKIGSFFTGGADVRRMARPHGVLMDEAGLLYVTDPGRRSLHIFDMGRHEYREITTHGRTRLLSPIGVAKDLSGHLYLSDSALGRVFVFNERGEPAGEIGGEGRLVRPTGVAVNSSLKRLYVIDTMGHCVQVFDLSGQFLFSIGKRGTGDCEFNFPTWIAIDGDSNLRVNDSLNFRVQLFDAEGRFLRLFGKHGDGMGEFSNPKGIAVDGEGHTYVADAIFDSIQIFDEQGRLLLSFGEAGQGAGEFWTPSAVFIDRKNRVFVSDSYNRRIQVFQFLGGD